jgi:hypothetical protein
MAATLFAIHLLVTHGSVAMNMQLYAQCVSYSGEIEYKVHSSCWFRCTVNEDFTYAFSTFTTHKWKPCTSFTKLCWSS